MITFEDVINKSRTLQNGCVVYLYTPKIKVMYNGKYVYFMQALAESVGKKYHGVCYRSCFTKDCINPLHIIWTREEKFWSNVEIKDDCNACWEWKSVSGTSKYAVTKFNGKDEAVHRIAYRLSFSDFPRELQVCHKCDNPPCCNPFHLFLGTFQDNVDDRERKGRNKLPHSLGEDHGNHKLTEKNVKEIRELYQTTSHNYRTLSEIYGVTFGAIRNVIKGRTWGWLK
jgi:hypothetical protein